jgi:hypothetical protein
MSRERTWWQRWVYDRERERQRREERTFTNSALVGLAYLVIGVLYVALCIALKVEGVFSYALAALIAGRGGVRVWLGIKRWRAGGEFNLPGKPGPVLLPPPRDTRGE